MGTWTYFQEVLVVWQLPLHVLIGSGIPFLVLGLEEECTKFVVLLWLIAVRILGGSRG